MSNIIILGGSGQLGMNLSLLFPNAKVFYHTSMDHENIDVSDFNSLREVFETEVPEIVINSSAFTNVDKAEVDMDLAFSINAIGVLNLVSLCRRYSSKLVHVSTDYVFNGQAGHYDEDATPDPINYYGFSKAMGDAFALSLDSSLIIRTSGIFGEKNNFPRFLYSMLSENREVNVLEGFYSPISAPILARSIMCILEHHYNISGILNVAGERVSRLEFATNIARHFNLDTGLIKVTKVLPNAIAKRPYDSSLNIKKAVKLIDFDFFSQGVNISSFSELINTENNR